jgi:hypothetical protein
MCLCTFSWSRSSLVDRYQSAIDDDQTFCRRDTRAKLAASAGDNRDFALQLSHGVSLKVSVHFIRREGNPKGFGISDIMKPWRSALSILVVDDGMIMVRKLPYYCSREDVEMPISHSTFR